MVFMLIFPVTHTVDSQLVLPGLHRSEVGCRFFGPLHVLVVTSLCAFLIQRAAGHASDYYNEVTIETILIPNKL